MEKHKMYKAAPASYHKHICVWFCNKKNICFSGQIAP